MSADFQRRFYGNGCAGFVDPPVGCKNLAGKNQGLSLFRVVRQSSFNQQRVGPGTLRRGSGPSLEGTGFRVDPQRRHCHSNNIGVGKTGQFNLFPWVILIQECIRH